LAAGATLAVPALATVTPVTRAAVTAVAPAGTVTALGGRRLLALGADLVEVDLAALVDVGDLDLDLVADVEEVLDLLDPLAVAHLGDVQQAVPPGDERDERAERGRLHDRAEELVAHLGHGRVGDRVDPLPGRLGGRAVGRADV